MKYPLLKITAFVLALCFVTFLGWDRYPSDRVLGRLWVPLISIILTVLFVGAGNWRAVFLGVAFLVLMGFFSTLRFQTFTSAEGILLYTVGSLLPGIFVISIWNLAWWSVFVMLHRE